MAILNSSLNLVDLDFNNLRNSFKTYLKDQPAFKDYDFEGSNIAVLLDLLAVNTFKTAFFTNMAINEGFIDSAQLRNSLFSQCKELNYLPRSIRSAQAKVRISFTATGDNQPYIIPKGSQLSTLIKSDSYIFSIPETLVVTSKTTDYSIETDIYEGIYRKDAYIYLDGIQNQRFKITNKNVDTRSVTVTVYEDGGEIGDTYTLSTTLLDLNFSSKVFFIQPSETGHYEIFFGDGILGREPKINSSIVIDYRVSKGPLGNGARSFAVAFDPTGNAELLGSPTVEVIEVAKNGEDEEDNQSIRYYAPRHFQTQERTVNELDYEVALKTQFPEISAISVYGGEKANPPKMGRVFVSVDIKNVDGLPDSKKNEYARFLERRSPFGRRAIFIEPDYMYLNINSLIRYNVNVTTNSINRIKTLVMNTIANYNNAYLNDFNVVFRKSFFSTLIDESDKSIISNQTDVKLYKKINPPTVTESSHVLNFGLELEDGVGVTFPNNEDDGFVVESSLFRYYSELVKIRDDGKGMLHIVKTDRNGMNISLKTCGSVDYKTGLVEIKNLFLDSYDGASLRIYVRTKDKDIQSTLNNILLIEPAEVSLDVESVQEN